jgi:hypothetical protein
MKPLGGGQALAFENGVGTLPGGMVGLAVAVLEDRRALVRRDRSPMGFDGASMGLARGALTPAHIIHPPARAPGGYQAPDSSQSPRLVKPTITTSM